MPKITEDKKKLIEQFWNKNIEDKRDIKTDIIYLDLLFQYNQNLDH